MAILEQGVSSQEVKKLQQDLNAAFAQSVVQPNGSFDEETTAAVKRFQGLVGLSESGIFDGKTATALRDTLAPRHVVTYNGKSYCLTEEEYQGLKKAMQTLATSPKSEAQYYVNMAKEATGLWKAHEETRDKKYISGWIIEAITTAKFPDKSVIDKAQQAGNRIQAALASGQSAPLLAAINDTAPIRDAFAQMSAYREVLYGGSDNLIATLDMYKDGCVVILTVLAAVATGGASTTVQVSVAAGMGGYKALLKEIDTAGKGSASQTVGTAITNIAIGAFIDGLAEKIMKGPASKKLIEATLKQIATGAAGPALKNVAQKELATFIESSIEGGGRDALKEAIKQVCNQVNPNDKTTFEESLGAIAFAFVKGAAIKQLGSKVDAIAGKSSSIFKTEAAKDKFFKKLGDINYDDAFKKGGEKVLDKAFDGAMAGAIAAAKGDPDNIEKEFAQRIVSDAAVQKWFADYQKKQGKK